MLKIIWCLLGLLLSINLYLYRKYRKNALDLATKKVAAYIESCVAAVEEAAAEAVCEAERRKIAATEEAERRRKAREEEDRRNSATESSERLQCAAEEKYRRRFMTEKAEKAVPLFMQCAAQGRCKEIDRLMNYDYVGIDCQDKVS
jgi:septin family protein